METKIARWRMEIENVEQKAKLAAQQKDQELKEKQKRIWKQNVVQWLSFLWKIFFAFVAVLDLSSCWETVYMGWTLGDSPLWIGWCPVPSNSSKAGDETPNFINSSHSPLRHSTCQAAHFTLFHLNRMSTAVAKALFSCVPGDYVPLHGFFCLLVLIEMIIRAFEAYKIALENQAIARFLEASIMAKIQSTTQMMHRRATSMDFGWTKSRRKTPTTSTDPPPMPAPTPFVSHTSRQNSSDNLWQLWIPVMITCFFWIALLPRSTGEYTSTIHAPLCGIDTSMAHAWIVTSFTNFVLYMTEFQERLHEKLWETLIMPYHAVLQPRRFWKRVRHLLRTIKLIRFAGPFARMSLKLGDQLFVMLKTRRQTNAIQEEKEKRVRRPSLLWQDLQKLEALSKVQTRLASLPSQLFELAQDHLPAKASVDSHRLLQQQKKHGRYIKRQLASLQREIHKSLSAFSISQAYDKIARLTQDISKLHSQQQQRQKSALSSLLNNKEFLISPRSRFSVVWRMTVTNCLTMELTRLAVSWYLTNTFQLSITQVISRLFIHCEHPKDTQKHLRFLTNAIDHWHKHLANAIPLIPFPQEKWIVCVPTSLSASLFLQLGFMMETFIDVVSFLDIFFWFFTGDLDELGLVVPKHFFTRCILPGTLVQVLDHPTLPEVLPSMMRQGIHAASAVGWGRTMRWGFAVGPALNLVFIQPMTRYFFRHFEDSLDEDGAEQDVLMKYAESMGYLPQRPSRMVLEDIAKPGHRRTKSPTSLSALNLARALNTPLDAMPDIAQSTPSTLSEELAASQEDSIHLNDDDDDGGGGEYSRLHSPSYLPPAFNSSVRFARGVTILDRLDSVDTSDGSDNVRDNSPTSFDVGGYGLSVREGEGFSSSSYDIGYSLSARDLQSMQDDLVDDDPRSQSFG
jgi:hypothetical protein